MTTCRIYKKAATSSLPGVRSYVENSRTSYAFRDSSHSHSEMISEEKRVVLLAALSITQVTAFKFDFSLDSSDGRISFVLIFLASFVIASIYSGCVYWCTIVDDLPPVPKRSKKQPSHHQQQQQQPHAHRASGPEPPRVGHAKVYPHKQLAPQQYDAYEPQNPRHSAVPIGKGLSAYPTHGPSHADPRQNYGAYY